MELPQETRLAWLRLIRSENVGPATFRTLINRFGGAAAALEALPDLAARGGRTIRVASRDAAEDEMARAERLGARFVCLGEPDFPQLLRRRSQAPPVLAVMGDAALFARPAVAIVGARNASLSGIKLTNAWSPTTSAGPAMSSSPGLPAASMPRRMRLASQTGTIGVFAGGLDRPYPAENRPLMRQIVDSGGSLVSEMPFGWEPRARDFPRRNRLVAGLRSGLLVVEAAMRSGSLISARLAGEFGRLVFAVPGSPLDPRAAGTNQLMKEGAILVTEAAGRHRRAAPARRPDAASAAGPSCWSRAELADRGPGGRRARADRGDARADARRHRRHHRPYRRVAGRRAARACSSSISPAGWSAIPAAMSR